MSQDKKYEHWELVISDLQRERDHAIALCDRGYAWRKAATERLERISALESEVYFLRQSLAAALKTKPGSRKEPPHGNT